MQQQHTQFVIVAETAAATEAPISVPLFFSLSVCVPSNVVLLVRLVQLSYLCGQYFVLNATYKRGAPPQGVVDLFRCRKPNDITCGRVD